MTPKTKLCKHCLLHIPLELFHKDSHGKDGYSARCARCRNEQKRLAKAQIKRLRPEENSYNKAPINPKKIIVEPEKSSFEEFGMATNLGDGFSPIVPETCELPADWEDVTDLVFAKIIEKADAHFSLSISRNKSARLSVHGSKQTIYKGESAADVIAKFLED